MAEEARRSGAAATGWPVRSTQARPGGADNESRWPGPGRLDLAPATAYEVVTRQMVEALGADLREIKDRLNGLLFLVAGAVVVGLTLRLAAV